MIINKVRTNYEESELEVPWISVKAVIIVMCERKAVVEMSYLPYRGDDRTIESKIDEHDHKLRTTTDSLN